MSIRAAYAGTFDPITNGHEDVIRRAAAMFDEIVVAVANNTSKQSIFQPEERLELAQAALNDLDNVVVMPCAGLIVEFAKDEGIQVLVRGVRGVGDYEYEKQMAVMNRHLASAIDTVLLASAPRFAHISSSLVREIAMLGGDISGLVPDVVVQRLKGKTG